MRRIPSLLISAIALTACSSNSPVEHLQPTLSGSTGKEIIWPRMSANDDGFEFRIRTVAARF